MIEKIVHTAKQTVNAMVDIQSARPGAFDAVKGADPSVRIKFAPRALPKTEKLPARTRASTRGLSGSFANARPLVGRARFP
jgi:hypothetical protein